jgi:hypothetical protein
MTREPPHGAGQLQLEGAGGAVAARSPTGDADPGGSHHFRTTDKQKGRPRLKAPSRCSALADGRPAKAD